MTDVEREFNKLWQEDVDEYNSRQTRKNLKKDNYFKELRENKKNEPIKEMVVQIGNKDNMGRDNPVNREKAKKVLLDFYKNFEKNYPDLKILGAVLHIDEATPHLHLTTTPYTENHGKNGLRHKQAWDEAYKNMGFKPEHSLLNKEEKKPIVFNGWRNHVQKLLDEAMNEQGFQREDQNVKHKHMSVKDYKEWSDIKNEQEEKLNQYEEIKQYYEQQLDSTQQKIKDSKVEEKEINKNIETLKKEESEIKEKNTNTRLKALDEVKQELKLKANFSGKFQPEFTRRN